MNAHYDHAPQAKDKKKPANQDTAVSLPSQVLVRAQLEMSEPGDSDEQEAEAVADSIIEEGRISRSVSGGHSGGGIALPSQMGSQLASLHGHGSQLYGSLKTQMESGFGRDFSDVRIHTGDAAARMSESISARAFTYGNDIFFNRDQFNPSSRDGQHLIAHELTHVVQGSGKVERRVKPGYLSSVPAMIDHLIASVSGEAGYQERVSKSTVESDKYVSKLLDAEKSKLPGSWNKKQVKAEMNDLKDKVWQFILQRDFKLKGDLSNNALAYGISGEAGMEGPLGESVLELTRRIVLKEQSGIPFDQAVDEESAVMQSLGVDKDTITRILNKARTKKDLDRVENALSGLAKEKKKLNGKKKLTEKEQKRKANIETIMGVIRSDRSFEDALNDAKAEMSDRGLSEEEIIKLEAEINAIHDSILLSRQENQKKQDESTSFEDALANKTQIMQSQGMEEQEINDAIEEIRNVIINDPLISKIIFEDPDNARFLDPKGQQNNTKFHLQIHKGMGPDAQWCDHFVHWCFLKAFDPYQFEDWDDEDKIRIRQQILKYTMFEKMSDGIDHTMKGSVSENMKGFGENAFLNSDYTIDLFDAKMKKKYSAISFNDADLNKQIEAINKMPISDEEKTKKILQAKYDYLKGHPSHPGGSDYKEANKHVNEYKELKKKKDKNTASETELARIEELEKTLAKDKTVLETGTLYSNWTTYKSLYDSIKGNYDKMVSDNRTEETIARSGDVVFFVGHIGIVVENKGQKVQTIEGNTNDAGSYTGDGVYLKDRDTTEILGYGRPKYEELRQFLDAEYDEILNPAPPSLPVQLAFSAVESIIDLFNIIRTGNLSSSLPQNNP